MIEVMKRNYKCKGLKTRKLNFDFEEADVEVEPGLLCEEKSQRVEQHQVAK